MSVQTEYLAVISTHCFKETESVEKAVVQRRDSGLVSGHQCSIQINNFVHRSASPSRPRIAQEIPQDFVAAFGHYRLRMKLHSLNHVFLVSNAHNYVFRGPGGQFQDWRESALLYYQRVIAASFKGVG